MAPEFPALMEKQPMEKLMNTAQDAITIVGTSVMITMMFLLVYISGVFAARNKSGWLFTTAVVWPVAPIVLIYLYAAMSSQY